MWHKMLRLGLLALAALNPPAFLFAQNSARGIKFERFGLEQGLSQSTVGVLHSTRPPEIYVVRRWKG